MQDTRQVQDGGIQGAVAAPGHEILQIECSASCSVVCIAPASGAQSSSSRSARARHVAAGGMGPDWLQAASMVGGCSVGWGVVAVHWLLLKQGLRLRDRHPNRKQAA